MKLCCEVSGIRTVVLGDIVFRRTILGKAWRRVEGYYSAVSVKSSSGGVIDIDPQAMTRKIKRFSEDPRYHVWVSGDTVNIQPVGKPRIHESDE